MEKKLFRCYKLNKWNYITLSVYLLLSFFLLTFFLLNKFDRKQVLFFYTFGTQFFIYGGQYRALRNFYYFLIWLTIGIIHFSLFLSLRNDPELAFVNGHASLGLRSTIISLLLYQFLRFISLTIQKKELVVPAKYGKYDLLDERKVTFLDYICFFTFFGLTLYFMV
ncbi:hypothetical protein [Flavobacterium sp. DG2-3]|uniref:hypothetical protein n=1 Tax=Flavobacterium sp. DG2-3 TaxID=3068317 RepID=UPI00273F6EBC|nr:hypothetical protein [Flavobacterium sp. DG2-3]MDP5200077.1 hypothetical protein [Flavobacterium sp. DG2-3]